MYEAMRQRAPFSTRATAMTATVLIAAAAGYVLLTGFGAKIIEAVQRPMVVVTLTPPPPSQAPLPTPNDDAWRNLTLEPAPIPQPQLDTFEPDQPAPADDGGLILDPGRDQVLPPPHPAVRISARMKPMDPPPYPPSEIRANAQGTSALEVCIDARGRVSSANLARSSGHARLDEAALKWVRDARFAPERVDGAAHAVCGHPVEYVWNLETLRR
jgi:periplasmic protein TonB